MLQPLLRATWAPRGMTPILKRWDRHDRLTVLSALTVSPQRRRLGLYFMVQRTTAKTDDVVAFLRSIRRHLRLSLIVVLDHLAAHRSAAPQMVQRSGKALQFEWLPAYAPELNPVEYVWCQSKYGHLANLIPRDIEHLHEHVYDSLEKIGRAAKRLHACFAHARLTL